MCWQIRSPYFVASPAFCYWISKTFRFTNRCCVYVNFHDIFRHVPSILITAQTDDVCLFVCSCLFACWFVCVCLLVCWLVFVCFFVSSMIFRACSVYLALALLFLNIKIFLIYFLLKLKIWLWACIHQRLVSVSGKPSYIGKESHKFNCNVFWSKVCMLHCMRS